MARFVTDGAATRDATYAAALLLDVGQLILACAAPLAFDRVLDAVGAADLPQHELEEREFGASQARVGAYLLGLWSLPRAIVEAVADHHDPARLPGDPSAVLAFAHLLDVLTDDPATTGAAAPLDLVYLKTGGWDHDLPRWRDIVARESSAAL